MRTRTYARLASSLFWLAASCFPAIAFEPAPRDSIPPSVDLSQQLQKNPLGPDENFRIQRLLEDPEQSALLVQVRGSLPPHIHRRTREIIYLLDGEGIFQLDAEKIPIRSGAVLRVQPGQVHTFVNQGPRPAAFLVVTTPRFDETDRIMVEGERGLSP